MMSIRKRVLVFVVVVVAVLTGTAAYAISDLRRSQAIRSAAPSVPSVDPSSAPTDAFIAFRHTGPDAEYGVVALVPLADPAGARSFTDTVCDRVYATGEGGSCLTTERGVVTTFTTEELDADWNVVSSAPLAGLPSRTRLSPDGSLVSTTSFVTGHSYMSDGFSTATEIRHVGGTSYGNLEKFTLDIDGGTVAPKDRNIWGVTFADDDQTFYATVATGGTTYLARGDLAAKTLSTIATDVECPSLSPDGTRVAFKQAGEVGGQPGWTPAVLDLATGERTVLDAETSNVDDQIEWLDDDTLLYGLPRSDEPTVTDVWSLDTTAGAEPELLIEQAWSPAVVR